MKVEVFWVAERNLCFEKASGVLKAPEAMLQRLLKNSDHQHWDRKNQEWEHPVIAGKPPVAPGDE